MAKSKTPKPKKGTIGDRMRSSGGVIVPAKKQQKKGKK